MHHNILSKIDFFLKDIENLLTKSTIYHQHSLYIATLNKLGQLYKNNNNFLFLLNLKVVINIFNDDWSEYCLNY